MGLADPRWAQDDHVVAVLDVVAAGQSHQLAFVDGRLIAEVEGLQGFHEGEAGHGRAHRDVLRRLGRHLLAEYLFEEVGIGQILGSGPL